MPTIHNDPRNMLDQGSFATDQTLQGLDDLENGLIPSHETSDEHRFDDDGAPHA